MAYREPPFNAASPSEPGIPEPQEFNGEEFLKLSVDERVRVCAQAAERAHNFARHAAESHKRSYLEMAQQWLLLAEAIMRDAQGKKSLRRF